VIVSEKERLWGLVDTLQHILCVARRGEVEVINLPSGKMKDLYPLTGQGGIVAAERNKPFRLIGVDGKITTRRADADAFYCAFDFARDGRICLIDYQHGPSISWVEGY
jgi:hypothetical protein